MSIARKLNRLLAHSGYQLRRAASPEPHDVYRHDGLKTRHNHDFMREPRFLAAYDRGLKAAGGDDYKWYWRVHIALWAARTAAGVAGDFVECGVNRGFLSSAIMHDLDWNRLGRTFYLLDTFAGLDERSADETHIAMSRANLASGFYVAGESGLESVRRNFAEWGDGARLVVGAVPETLDQVDAARVAFLSLDMNHAGPEAAALERLWPRLSPGAVVLSDDYAYLGYPEHKPVLDAAAGRLGVSFAALPSGQGLLIKPCAPA